MLNYLYDLVNNEKISLSVNDLDSANGYYINTRYGSGIILDKKIINTKMEKIVLAEELGHHFTGVTPTLPFATDYYTKLIRSKNEFKAFKWSINQIIPPDTLKRFLDTNKLNCEVSEELGVPEEFLKKAYNYYKENNYL